MDQLTKLSELHPREGFWKSYNRMRNKSILVNHKRLHRVYKEMGLPLRRKVKKRLPSRIKEPLVVPQKFNETWSIDFVHDVLENGRKFRSFNVIDDFNREALMIKPAFSLSANNVIKHLNHLAQTRGYPKSIRTDNGPEFKGDVSSICAAHGVTIQRSLPYSSHAQGKVERLHRTLEQLLSRTMTTLPS